jgi:hypothetical protein
MLEALLRNLSHTSACGHVKSGANTRAVAKSFNVECNKATEEDCCTVEWS